MLSNHHYQSDRSRLAQEFKLPVYCLTSVVKPKLYITLYMCYIITGKDPENLSEI